ncbi:MAG: glutamine amidotransferase [Pseudomonadota bacterium]
MSTVKDKEHHFNGGTCADTVVLVDHPGGGRDDRLSRRLSERGFQIQWVCPGDGQALPEVTERLAGAAVYGGPQSVNDGHLHSFLDVERAWIERWLKSEKPFFGICLGGQMLAQVLGATVGTHEEGLHEIGYRKIEPVDGQNGFLGQALNVYHWHNEGFDVPRTAELLARGVDFPNQAFRYGSKTYGIQFHPEVTPHIFKRWIGEAGHMLANPGADPADRQTADGEAYDRALGDWLDSFLDHWIGYPEESEKEEV